MSFENILEKILQRVDLNRDEAKLLMELTMTNQLSTVQIAAWLTSIRTKSETPLEVASFAEVMRKESTKFETEGIENAIDTCGTGGDKSNLMNVSTLVALTLAAMGHPVVKHGNRSVSSTCGSADILEALGYPLETDLDTLKNIYRKSNFVFLFAPKFHPSMKYVAPVRKELKVRTVFNILGPLANPAFTKRHLLGAFSHEVASLMAHAHQKLGTKTALVLHSTDGLDEISPIAKTKYYFLSHDKISEGMFDPEKLKLKILSLNEIQIENKEKGIEILNQTIEGKNIPAIETVALNTTAALYVIDYDAKKTEMPFQEYMEKNFEKSFLFIKEKNVMPILDLIK